MTIENGGLDSAETGSDGRAPELPFLLGPYRIERVLGRGGMGIVYAAHDRRLGRRVAIKRIRAGADDSRRRARLRREARTAAQLTHPAVIRIFDLVEDADGDWIVMELVEGTTLADRLADGPLDVGSVLRYARQIADGLAAAHRLGIVHRDLKTENIMILPDGRVKILDFGIAKQIDFVAAGAADQTLSRTGEVLGTSRAMAPEQARGLAVGPRSDLFSFGVLLYEAATGVSPFRARSALATLTRVVTHRPKPIDELRPDVPRALAELVERLLRKSAEHRPASADQVSRELARLVDQRRAEGAADPSDETVDADATVGTNDLFRAEADHQPTFSYDHGFGVSLWPNPARVRAVGLAVAVAVVIVAALLITSRFGPRSPGAQSPGAAGPRDAGAPAADDDPVRLYEEAMEALRRVDRAAGLDRAIRVFLDLLDRDPHSAAAHAGLARAYWEKSRNASGGGDPVYLEQALALAEEAVRLDTDLPDARTSLGLIYFAQGRHDRAREELETALELDSAQADACYGLAKVAEAQGRPDEAEARYRRAGELRPRPLYFNALGSMLYDRGRYDDAEQAFLQSLDADPDNVHALRNLGGIYYALGRPDEAASTFQSALEIRPNASLYSNLGTIFFSRGLYSKAVTAFEDALAMDGASNQYIYWLNLADAYRQLPGKQDEARRSYGRALQILDSLVGKKPDDVRLRSRRALARARSGNRDGALSDIERLRESGTGGDLYSLFRQAVAEELCGQRESALGHLEEAFLSGLSLAEARSEPDLQELRADLRFHHILVALDVSGEPSD